MNVEEKRWFYNDEHKVEAIAPKLHECLVPNIIHNWTVISNGNIAICFVVSLSLRIIYKVKHLSLLNESNDWSSISTQRKFSLLTWVMLHLLGMHYAPYTPVVGWATQERRIQEGLVIDGTLFHTLVEFK